MDKLYIVIPAYNEEANIQKTIDEWYGVIVRHQNDCDGRLLVIDDGSKDSTYKIMQECKHKYPLLDIITKPNGGHGATVLYGYKFAIENNADFVFQTDSDGQTSPIEFDQFWKLRDNYDLLIGWRNNREDGLSRIFVTKVLKIIIQLFFSVSVLDANTPFRLMKSDSLKKVLKYVPDNFNLSNVIVCVAYIKCKYKVRFIPISFKARQGGKNSINFSRIFSIGKRAVLDFWNINEAFRKDGIR